MASFAERMRGRWTAGLSALGPARERLRERLGPLRRRLGPLGKRLAPLQQRLEKLPGVRRLRLPAVFAVFFLLFLRAGFPWDLVARRIEAEAGNGGVEVAIGAMGPEGLFGLRARDVRVRSPGEPGELVFPVVELNPDVLPLLLGRTSFGFTAHGYGGTARGHARLSSDPRRPGLSSLELDARGLDLHALPLPPSLQDAELAGRLGLKVDLPSLDPLETSTGKASLSIQGAALLRAVARLEGGMSLTLPRVSLGDVDAAAALDKGVAKVERLSARGGDVDAEVDGTIALRPALLLSQADLHLKLRPSERWMQENPVVRGALGALGPRAPDGSYTVTFSGPLLRLQPRPGR